MPTNPDKKENVLKGSEEKYKLMLDNANDLISIINDKFVHEYINEKAYFDLLGYSEEDIIGKSPLIPLHPDDQKIGIKALKNGFKFGEGRNEMRVKHKEGHYLWLENKGKTFIDADGKKKAIIISRDITERKKAEFKIKESEEKYKLISENANDLIFIVSENLKIEYVNKKPLLKLTGYLIDEVIGKRALKYIHLDDAENAMETFYKAFEKEGHETIEARVKHKNGHYIFVEINGSLFYNEKGEPKALLITRDITDRKNAERHIIAENKELMELSQIKSELITKASHEFKTPLSSIYGASQILLKDFKDQLGEDALGFVKMIHRGGQKLKQLIENLLDLPGVESGKLTLTINKENLSEIIKECISHLDYLANERNINISYTLPKELNLEIDGIKFQQVVNNLLSNAIKNTPPEGKIIITSKITNKWVEVSFKDTGIGLTKKEKELLFQKYGKINRNIKNLNIDIDGSGLGLYISKEIIELHKGNILVKSMGRNKGSTFTIRLPNSI